jgi:hypothetical protein
MFIIAKTESLYHPSAPCRTIKLHRGIADLKETEKRTKIRQNYIMTNTKSPLGRLTMGKEICGPHHYQPELSKIIRQERPKIVVETGLQSGYSSEHILVALDDLGAGHLYSIDPIPEPCHCPLVHPRFTHIIARSQDALKPLYEKVGQFDFFIHDSDHEHECMSFELEAAWEYVRDGGIIAGDDLTWGTPPHNAWPQFLARHGIPPWDPSIDGPVVHKAGAALWFRRPNR